MISSTIFPSKAIHTIGHKFMRKQYLRDSDGISKDESHSMLCTLADVINNVIDQMPQQFAKTSHVSPSKTNRNLTFRLKRGKNTYTVDIQLTFLTSVENHKQIKESLPSLRVRTLTIVTNPTSGLKILSENKDHHLFLPSSMTNMSYNLYACSGYDLLHEMINHPFTKVPV